MRDRHSATVVAVMVVAVLFAGSGAAQPPADSSSGSASPPLTAWGHPNLQGMWVNNSATPIERPTEFAGKQTLSDKELAELKKSADAVRDGGDAFFGDDFVKAAVAKGTNYRSFDNNTGNYNQFWIVEREIENRTSLIVDPPDGRLPPMTPLGEQRAADRAKRSKGEFPAGPEDINLSARCITYGMPNLLAGYNSYYQFLQTPNHVIIYQELIHDARIIPLDGRPHLPGNVRQWHGDPRGRWEGDTLVVESRNFSPQSYFRGTGEHLHLIERFQRVDADTVAYDITVNDPTIYTKPWTAVIFLKSTQDAIFEYACHEGNISMEGMLTRISILALVRSQDTPPLRRIPRLFALNPAHHLRR